MLPEVEHWSNSYEIVEHLRALQEMATPFEVGMSTRAGRDPGVPAAGLRATCGTGGAAVSATPEWLRCCDDRWNSRDA